jgi:putative transcriptional regulator
MNRNTLAELAAGHALGNLDPDEQLQLDTLLAQDPSARLEVAALIDTAAAIATAGAPPVTPSEAQRARILAAVKAASQQERPVSQAPLSQGYTVLADSSEGWVESGMPGFRTKLLSKGPHPEHQVYLIALEPGAKVVEHVHSGIEEMYIISGHLDTEGHVLGPGDFMRGEAGTHHHECSSPDGCVALLILSPALAA